MIIAFVSVAVDVKVSVGCEIDCKVCNKRSRVGLEIIIVGGIAAEIGIESGKVVKVKGYIELPNSLVTRGL
jgi:hypothetical protein